MKLEVSDQVLEFVQGQAPEIRHRLRLAIRRLAAERGDARALVGPLQGYSRLRVGAFRIVFAQTMGKDRQPCRRCVFAERRDVVYAIFSDMLRRHLTRD